MTWPLAPRYGIAEWYGQSFRDLTPIPRQTLARIARNGTAKPPLCPFQYQRSCSKMGWCLFLAACPVGHSGPHGLPLETSPHRFDEAGMLVQ